MWLAGRVSKATVSAVLNNTGSVKATTREQVVAVMELLNYRPTQLAGRSAARRVKSIGLLIKEIDNPYYAEIVLGARTLASQNGYTLLVASSEGEFEAERRAIELLQAKDVDGLVATPVLTSTPTSPTSSSSSAALPFVLLEEVSAFPEPRRVDKRRRPKAVEYLIEQGHTPHRAFRRSDVPMHARRDRWRAARVQRVAPDLHRLRHRARWRASRRRLPCGARLLPRAAAAIGRRRACSTISSRSESAARCASSGSRSEDVSSSVRRIRCSSTFRSR